MVHLCQNILGYLKNEGYYLLSSQPTIDTNTLQMFQQNLTSWGVDVTQAVMLPPYNDYQCAMLMNSNMMPNMMNSTMTMPIDNTTNILDGIDYILNIYL